ncbi:MAG: DUF4190 domain-containing protein [Deltaproteobacteria bacterium]|nr:DUF4190 domain-containing protein [Deltaproteobacteria bacterium]
MNGSESSAPPPAPGAAATPQATTPQAPSGSADSRAVTSLVLGILAVLLGWLPLVGLALGVIAIVNAARFLGAQRKPGVILVGKGMAIVGLILGIVGVVANAALMIYFLLKLLWELFCSSLPDTLLVR